MRKITEVGIYILHVNEEGVFEVIEIIEDVSLSYNKFYFRIRNINDKISFQSADEYIKEILTKEENPEYYL